MDEFEYKANLDILKEKGKKFGDYFEKNVHSDREYWRRDKRDHLIGVWNTNNYAESIIKNMEVCFVCGICLLC